MKQKILFSLIYVVLVICLFGCGNGKTEEKNSSVSYDDNLIISNLTINNVKLSELNSVKDILTKVNGSKKSGITVCLKDVDGCPTYTIDEFDKMEKDKNISSIGIRIELGDTQSNIIQYWLYYNNYKNDLDNAPYFMMEIMSNNGLVQLDNKDIKEYTKNELNNKYTITKTDFGDRQYIYEFVNNKNDKVSLSGYFGSRNMEIFNYGERDRSVK